jgi:hypothetical protein
MRSIRVHPRTIPSAIALSYSCSNPLHLTRARKASIHQASDPMITTTNISPNANVRTSQHNLATTRVSANAIVATPSVAGVERNSAEGELCRQKCTLRQKLVRHNAPRQKPSATERATRNDNKKSWRRCRPSQFTLRFCNQQDQFPNNGRRPTRALGHLGRLRKFPSPQRQMSQILSYPSAPPCPLESLSTIYLRFCRSLPRFPLSRG